METQKVFTFILGTLRLLYKAQGTFSLHQKAFFKPELSQTLGTFGNVRYHYWCHIFVRLFTDCNTASIDILQTTEFKTKIQIKCGNLNRNRVRTSWCFTKVRITTFSVLSVHKNTQLLCIHSSRGWKSTIKKFLPIQHLFKATMYVLRNIVICYTIRKKRRKKGIISYKHEPWKKKVKKHHLRCEEKCNEEISRFFPSLNSFATSCVEG